ncbi:MAG: tyrosine-type recombinase/integrase, partial [Psychrobium sp.]|nr:tyrosine-type recombinase/integrase [Psychrobium sp.]
MAIKVKPLTATEVKAAKPKIKEYNLSDGDGLMLRVKPNASKLWLFNYRHPVSKKRKIISFGQYPEITLAQARELRLTTRTLLTKNIDPQSHRDNEIKSKQRELNNTFKHIAALWLESKKTKIQKDTAADIWRSLERHLFPALANIPILEINAPDTIDILRPVEKSGSLETVKRLCQRINEIMTYSVNHGYIKDNPTSGIKNVFQDPIKQHMPTIHPDKLPIFFNVFKMANITHTCRYLIQWSLHTLVRPSEAAGAAWAEIDFDNKVWHIPAQRMKKKRPHSIPLTAQALEILAAIKPITGHRKWIFASIKDPSKPCNEQTANAAIKRMGYKGILTAHGLRSIGSTALNDHGFDGDVIESALSHL